MKLRVKDRARLQTILDNLERGRAYLMRQDVAVCKKGGSPTTTLHAVSKQGEVYYEVNKEVGSELTLLHTGIGQLRQALEADE